MNRAAGQPLVETATGGKKGGGAQLTALGRALLEASRLLNQRLGEFVVAMDAELDALFSKRGGALFSEGELARRGQAGDRS